MTIEEFEKASAKIEAAKSLVDRIKLLRTFQDKFWPIPINVNADNQEVLQQCLRLGIDRKIELLEAELAGMRFGPDVATATVQSLPIDLKQAEIDKARIAASYAALHVGEVGVPIVTGFGCVQE